MSHHHSSPTPVWKRTAVHCALALMLSNLAFVPNAQAMLSFCPETIDADQSACQATDESVTTVSGGVSVSTGSGAALLYPVLYTTYTIDSSSLVSNLGNLAGSLTNNGTISSSGSYSPNVGVDIENELMGTLTNTSTGKIEGISTSTDGDAVAYGIREGSIAYMSGTLSNSGSISATATATSGLAKAYGIYINNAISSTGLLTNSGSISATATAINSDSAFAYGVYVDSSMAGTINNSGSISASATVSGTAGSPTAEAYGVYVGGNLSGSLTNTGSISATAAVTAFGTADQHYAAAYGVYVGSDLSGSLAVTSTGSITATATNSGTADGSSVSAYATGVEVRNSLSGSLTNSGTISATASATGTAAGDVNATANGVYVSTVNTDGVVTNTGTITATATAAGHHGSENMSYAFAAGLNISSLQGVVNNSGTISGVVAADPSQGYSIWVEGASPMVSIVAALPPSTSTMLVSVAPPNPTINNLAGGLLDGNIGINDAAVTLNNAGTIRIPVGVQGYIAGTYNQSATGVLSITATSTSNYSQLAVGGTATIDPAATIHVSAQDGTHTLAKGEILDSVLSAGTLDSTTVNVTDSSLLFNFKPIITAGAAGHIDLQVEAGTSVVTAVTNNLNFAGLGAAGLLDNLIANGSPGMSGVITTLGGLGTEREVSDAVRQMLPLVTTGTTGAIRDGLSGINRVIQARVDANHGLSAGDDLVTNRSVWLKPLGAWADQDDSNGVSGYSADAAGVVIGADGAISDKSRVGGALAIMRVNVDSNASGTAGSQSANIDGYQAVVYGSYSLDNRTDINWQADVGLNQTKGTRNLPLFAVVAKSDYDSVSTHIGAGVGRIYDLGPKTTFTPSVRADYTSIRDKSYVETGAGALNLNVDANTTDEFILSVDGKWIHTYSDKTKVMANLGVGYDTMADRASITSSFVGGGAAFTTQGLDKSPWLVRAGLGLVMTTSSAMEITARYDLEARQDAKNQTLSVKFRMPF